TNYIGFQMPAGPQTSRYNLPPNQATGLLHNVAGSLTWSLVSLTSDVTGTLPAASGGFDRTFVESRGMFADGSDGEDGMPGPRGADGAAGAAGATGAAGAPGPAIYLTGDDGIDGLDGIPGPRGADGATGASGATGAQG